MNSQAWSFRQLSATLTQASLEGPDAEPPRRDFFVPQPATVPDRSHLSSYPQTHLLGIPQEIRDRVWQVIYSDIKAELKSAWHSKPKTSYDALALVCTQIYSEIEGYWRRAIVPKHRLKPFLAQPYSAIQYKGFKRLSVEVPFNMSGTFFSWMSKMLIVLSPHLQDFRLFFTGGDAYGTQVSIHGCGNEAPAAVDRAAKLPVDGQDFHHRVIFLTALVSLTQLRTLVLSNSNFAYLQTMLIQNKHKLRKLYVVDDPRASLTKLHWDSCFKSEKSPIHGLMTPVNHSFPPVRHLHISANAALTSVQVVNKLSHTLESLTWIVPDPSRQSGGFDVNWFRDTGIILGTLRAHANKLHTIRVCFEGAMYEAQTQYGDFIHGFRHHMPFLDSLRTVELHLWSKSPYIYKELLEAIPRRVERIYVADRFVTASQLIDKIAELYLPVMPEQLSTSQSMYSIQTNELEGGEDLDDNIQSDSSAAIITADEIGRKDYIPMGTGNITFVGYEYTRADKVRVRIVEREDIHPLDISLEADGFSTKDGTILEDGSESVLSGQALQQRLNLLILNGRLLDRARNKHIHYCHRLRYIKPIMTNGTVMRSNVIEDLVKARGADIPKIDTTATSPSHAAIEAAVSRLKAPPIGEVRTNTSFLSMSPFTDDLAYFGSETEAEIVFANEKVAEVGDVAARRWCEEVVVEKGMGHWQSESQ